MHWYYILLIIIGILILLACLILFCCRDYEYTSSRSGYRTRSEFATGNTAAQAESESYQNNTPTSPPSATPKSTPIGFENVEGQAEPHSNNGTPYVPAQQTYAQNHGNPFIFPTNGPLHPVRRESQHQSSLKSGTPKLREKGIQRQPSNDSQRKSVTWNQDTYPAEDQSSPTSVQDVNERRKSVSWDAEAQQASNQGRRSSWTLETYEARARHTPPPASLPPTATENDSQTKGSYVSESTVTNATAPYPAEMTAAYQSESGRPYPSEATTRDMSGVRAPEAIVWHPTESRTTYASESKRVRGGYPPEATYPSESMVRYPPESRTYPSEYKVSQESYPTESRKLYLAEAPYFPEATVKHASESSGPYTHNSRAPHPSESRQLYVYKTEIPYTEPIPTRSHPSEAKVPYPLVYYESQAPYSSNPPESRIWYRPEAVESRPPYLPETKSSYLIDQPTYPSESMASYTTRSHPFESRTSHPETIESRTAYEFESRQRQPPESTEPYPGESITSYSSRPHLPESRAPYPPEAQSEPQAPYHPKAHGPYHPKSQVRYSSEPRALYSPEQPYPNQFYHASTSPFQVTQAAEPQKFGNSYGYESTSYSSRHYQYTSRTPPRPSSTTPPRSASRTPPRSERSSPFSRAEPLGQKRTFSMGELPPSYWEAIRNDSPRSRFYRLRNYLSQTSLYDNM